MMYEINKAINIAELAHAGLFRRDGVTPYITHVARVSEIVQQRKGTDEQIIVAFLHDVIENNANYTFALLRANGFSDEIVDAVDALTHRPNETYMDSIRRAKANPVAKDVKIADNLANLGDNPTNKQILKYCESLQFLMAP